MHHRNKHHIDSERCMRCTVGRGREKKLVEMREGAMDVVSCITYPFGLQYACEMIMLTCHVATKHSISCLDGDI